jgi:hypothetical protein
MAQGSGHRAQGTEHRAQGTGHRAWGMTGKFRLFIDRHGDTGKWGQGEKRHRDVERGA